MPEVAEIAPVRLEFGAIDNPRHLRRLFGFGFGAVALFGRTFLRKV